VPRHDAGDGGGSPRDGTVLYCSTPWCAGGVPCLLLGCSGGDGCRAMMLETVAAVPGMVQYCTVHTVVRWWCALPSPWLQRRYGCRAMMLETVAAVPGMVQYCTVHTVVRWWCALPFSLVAAAVRVPRHDAGDGGGSPRDGTVLYCSHRGALVVCLAFSLVAAAGRVPRHDAGRPLQQSLDGGGDAAAPQVPAPHRAHGGMDQVSQRVTVQDRAVASVTVQASTFLPQAVLTLGVRATGKGAYVETAQWYFYQ